MIVELVTLRGSGTKCDPDPRSVAADTAPDTAAVGFLAVL